MCSSDLVYSAAHESNSIFLKFHQYVCMYVRMHICMYVCTYVFLAVLGLCCCAGAFSSCSEQGLLFVEVYGLLIAVASLVAQHGL